MPAAPSKRMCSGDFMADESAVSDTGPPLHLSEIEQERLLNLFKSVTIPEDVKIELTRHGAFNRIARILNDRLLVETITQAELDKQYQLMTDLKVHKTDLSIAVLAARLLPDLVLTDDLELRKGLEVQSFMVVGSVGVLVRAFKADQLTKAQLQNCFDRLFDGSTLYLSKGFAVYVRKLLNSM